MNLSTRKPRKPFILCDVFGIWFIICAVLVLGFFGTFVFVVAHFLAKEW